MYAVRLHEFGPAENLQYEQIASPFLARDRFESTCKPAASTSSRRRCGPDAGWDLILLPNCPSFWEVRSLVS
jgi:hypothetical protein